MTEFPILSLLTFAPICFAVLIYLFGYMLQGSQMFYKISGLSASLAVMLCSLYVYSIFDPSTSDYQLSEKVTWLSEYGVYYALGIDGISMPFVLLTAIIIPICFMSGIISVKNRAKEFTILFLSMETLILGTFLSLDLLLFYIMFEAILIPMYLIIGIWGGENRIYAAIKFFLYTLAGSVLLLIASLYIMFQAETTYMPYLVSIVSGYEIEIQKLLWVAFFISFAVKMPMIPVHTWLPDAHVQAPTAGSVVLAGILLKLGGYGFIRFLLPWFPTASVYFGDSVLILSIVAVIYTSLIALIQTDMKKLIAYSSIAHMGYVTAGVFSFNVYGIEGAIFQMISHGFVSGALFMCVGVLYDRMHTKEIIRYGGVVKFMPKFSLLFMIFLLGSIGMPATSGFVGEIMVLIGVFKDNVFTSVLLATGMFLSAAYMLWLYRRVIFGDSYSPDVRAMHDISWLEKAALLPLAIFIILLGVYPAIILDIVHSSVADIASTFQP